MISFSFSFTDTIYMYIVYVCTHQVPDDDILVCISVGGGGERGKTSDRLSSTNNSPSLPVPLALRKLD